MDVTASKSEPTMRRRAMGTEPQKAVDPSISAMKRAAVAKRWGKEKGIDPQIISRTSAQKEQERMNAAFNRAFGNLPNKEIPGVLARLATIPTAVQNVAPNQMATRHIMVMEALKAAPWIWKNVIEIAKGEKGMPGEQLAAAKFVLGEARLLTENMPNQGNDKPSGEKSLDELEAEVRELEARIKQREATAASSAIVTDAEILDQSPQVPDSIEDVSDTQSGTQDEGDTKPSLADSPKPDLDLDDALT
jgi:hypothetical protein